MKKLYLDIDGVLLTKNLEVPEYLDDFVEFITSIFDCFWLTTHCKGDARTALRYLETFLPKPLINQLKQVKPTHWQTLKTEAINFEKNFYWLDDFPFESEKKVLTSYQKLDNLIQVDLNREGELLRIINVLKY